MVRQASTPGNPHVRESVLDPLPWQQPQRTPSRWERLRRGRAPKVGIAVAVFVVLLTAALSVHLHYDVFVPGEAPNAEDLVQINSSQVHTRAGSIHLTTVGVYYGVRLPQLIAAWFDKTAQVVSEAAYPNVPNQEIALMDQSQHDAEVAALGELYGYQNLPNDGVLIESLVSNSPAAKVLQPGDVITDVDGAKVASPDQLEAGVQRHAVGDSVHLTVLRNGATKDFDVETMSNAQPPPPTIIGVEVEPDYQLPSTLQIKISAGDIGGPSAGLSWALAIVNKLGSTDLTRGRVIADTGTIDYAGNVGEIGGIAQKVVGAERVKASTFIVPRTQVGDAQAEVNATHSHMRVVGVSTLHEAVEALSAP